MTHLDTHGTPVQSVVLRRFAERPSAAVRLVCIPHAGAGASMYGRWPALLPPSIELLAVQLPGREDRLREAPFTEWAPLVEAAGVALAPFATKPIALFGHSFGAVLAWELALWLAQRRPRDLAHLFVSGRRGPDQTPPATSPLATLPDEQFLETLDRRYGTFGVASIRHPEILELVLPALRADVTLLENHNRKSAPPIACPLTGYLGLADPSATAVDLDGWRRESLGTFRSRLFEGGHFYLTDRREDVVADVARSLLSVTA